MPKVIPELRKEDIPSELYHRNGNIDISLIDKSLKYRKSQRYNWE